jgi:hypothetical protein
VDACDGIIDTTEKLTDRAYVDKRLSATTTRPISVASPSCGVFGLIKREPRSPIEPIIDLQTANLVVK